SLSGRVPHPWTAGPLEGRDGRVRNDAQRRGGRIEVALRSSSSASVHRQPKKGALAKKGRPTGRAHSCLPTIFSSSPATPWLSVEWPLPPLRGASIGIFCGRVSREFSPRPSSPVPPI